MTNLPEISIALQTNKPLQEYARIASSVEDYGFDRITVYNDLLYQPAWYPLMIMAQATETIRLGVSAVNPFTSHPVNIAGNIALLDEVSKGRAYLGIARGAWLDFLALDHPNPISAVKDAIVAVKHLLAQDKSELYSNHFPLKGGDVFRWTILRADVPILLGTWGLKLISKCLGNFEEVKLGGTANPEVTKYYHNKIVELAKSANLDKIPQIVAGAVCVVDKESEVAKAHARKEVALYLPVIAHLDPTLKIRASVLVNIEAAAAEFNFEEAGSFISDEMLRKFSFSGTSEDVIRQTISLLDSGTFRVEFGTPHGLDSENGINLLGTKVLPAVREHIDDHWK